MPVGYRSIFTVSGGQDAIDVARDQFRSWLRRKHYDPDVTVPGMHVLGEHARLFVTETRPADRSRSLRYRLVEASNTGEWTTTVTAHVARSHEGWIWADVNAPPARGDELAARWTAVPRLVRDILSVTNAFDGEMMLSGRPTLVTRDEVEDLISAVCDPGRRGVALVAAPIPDVAQPLLIEHVARLTYECVGLGGSYVLDQEAADFLMESFGPSHAVPLGAIRSYLPGADPASTVDARRHRVLLARTIAVEDAGGLAHLLGQAARRRMSEIPLPPSVARVDRLLEREEPAAALGSIQKIMPTTSSGVSTRNIRESVIREAEQIAADAAAQADAAVDAVVHATESVAPVEEAANVAARDVTSLSKLLAGLVSEFSVGKPGGITQASIAGLVDTLRELLVKGHGALQGYHEMSRRVAALQDRVDETTDHLDGVRTRLEEEQLDHAVTQEELLDSKAETDRLRAALAKAGQRGEAWTIPAVAPPSPGSFEELLDRLCDSALPQIEFTGDAKVTLALDEHDPLGTWAAKTWDILRVLDGYADARHEGEFGQGVHAYLGETPPGRPGYSVRMHASQESDTVEKTPKFRNARILPVPSDVRPEGSVFMGAHFKIAQKGLISPRLYYCDDTSGTGKIYIGYIGKHLPNPHTN